MTGATQEHAHTGTPGTPDMPGLAVLISGGGRTMVNIAHRCADGTIPARVAVVIASRDCAGIERASELGLPTLRAPGELAIEWLEELSRDYGFSYAALAGYLRLFDVPPPLEGRVLNIHPALLPGNGTAGPFGGRGMHGMRVHEAVLASGAHESGCTVHLVNHEYDAGEIILQRRCPVEPGDTPETLAARVFELEREAYPEALRLVIERDAAARAQER